MDRTPSKPPRQRPAPEALPPYDCTSKISSIGLLIRCSCSDTPRSARHDAGPRLTTDLRETFGETISSELLRCRPQAFLDHNFPPSVANGDVIAKAIDRLREEKLMKSVTPSSEGASPRDVFHNFEALRQAKRSEKVTYNSLIAIGQCIQRSMKASGEAPPNDYFLKECGEQYLKSELRGVNNKIDACLSPDQTDDSVLHTTRVILPFEFKRSRADTTQVRNLNGLSVTQTC